jgi:hypothetical protein
MRRALRSARAVMHGGRILDFVRQNKTRLLLVAAAESGAPPVTAISEQLVKLIGIRDAKLQPVKQFVGVCVRAVLEEEGFNVAEKGVRVSGDPVFRTGSTYERAADEPAESSFLARFVANLTDSEALQVLNLLKSRNLK